jgi:Zn-dependent protease
VVAALLLFISVLVHELAHSLVARSRGVPVKSITLFLLGGVSNLESEPEKPAVEFAIAIVGPLTSIALAGLFWALDLSGLGAAEPVKATIVYMIEINVLLAAFNILPGFPLDGGRIAGNTRRNDDLQNLQHSCSHRPGIRLDDDRPGRFLGAY